MGSSSGVEPVTVDQELVRAAIELVELRLPGQQWAGAAAMRLSDGSIVTSTAPSVPNLSVQICHETGALCEAYKVNKPVRDSVCVIRTDQGGRFWILTPCGVCQERLFAYGPSTQVGVPSPADPEHWQSMRLDEVQPHWWSKVFQSDESEA